jgi:FAD/FMN-containing dehydrogenase
MDRLPRCDAVSRRQFVAAMGALASSGLAGCGLRPTLSEVNGADAGEQTARLASSTAWRILERLVYRVLTPNDGTFLAKNKRYGGTVPYRVARCATVQHVTNAIRWCRQNDVPFAIRSGGHSYAGYSTTAGLLIDISLMNTVLAKENGNVIVSGGARNRDLQQALRTTGRSVTHGRCPTVGVAGFVLGGGIGFDMRAFGLACDQVVGTDVVLADGTLVSADASRDEQIFWACRGGGGGNFGISTSFTLRTFPVGGPVTVFDISWRDRQELVLQKTMRALNQAPFGLASRLSISAVSQKDRDSNQEMEVRLVGQFHGAEREARKFLASAYHHPPATEQIREVDYWQAQAMLEEPGDEEACFQERSGFVRGELSDQAWAAALRWLRTWPGTGEDAYLVFFQTGGQVNDPERFRDTAFVHRRSDWLLVVGLNWTLKTDPAVLRDNREWQDRFYDDMRLLAGIDGAYQNFVDPSLVDWRLQYYGEAYDKLVRVKIDVDPANVFRFPQAIGQ